MTATRMRDPFAPIEWIVFVIWWLLLGLPFLFISLFLVDQVTGGPEGGRITVFGYGSEEACASATNEQVDGTRPRGVVPLVDRASARGEVLDICLDEPSFGEQTAAGAGDMTRFASSVAAVFLLRRLIRRGRRELFGGETARLATALGWVLVIGGLATALVTALGNGLILRRALVDAPGWTDAVVRADVSWTLVVAGLGVVAVGRILRWALVLQEEVDTLV